MTIVIKELRRRLVDDAERSGVPGQIALVLFLLPLVGGLFVAASRLSGGAFKFITGEDHLLEWTQFAGYAIASVVAFVVAVRLARSGQWLVAGAWLVLAFGCTMVAGEEISWGQRIFGFKTPAVLEGINHQEEANIHNIRSIQDALNLVLLFGGLFGAAAPWLIRGRSGKYSTETAKLFLPALFLTSAFFFVFAYKLARLELFPAPHYTVVKFGEWAEFCFSYGLAAFTLLTYRSLRVPPFEPSDRRDQIAARVSG